jgi:hypothetical protein
MSPVLGIIASSNQQGRGGGPISAYDALASVTLTANATTINFTGIPAGYEHLQLRIHARSDHPSFGGVDGIVRFNNDSSSTYAWHYMIGSGGPGMGASATINTTSIVPGIIASGNGSPSNIYATTIMDILDYSSASKFKTTRSLDGLENNQSSGRDLRLSSGLWRNTSAITSITITSSPSQNFIQYSQFALYGVK